MKIAHVVQHPVEIYKEFNSYKNVVKNRKKINVAPVLFLYAVDDGLEMRKLSFVTSLAFERVLAPPRVGLGGAATGAMIGLAAFTQRVHIRQAPMMAWVRSI